MMYGTLDETVLEKVTIEELRYMLSVTIEIIEKVEKDQVEIIKEIDRRGI